jgi:hypothetical protein
LQPQLSFFESTATQDTPAVRDRTKLTPIDPVGLAALRDGQFRVDGDRVYFDLPQMTPAVYAKIKPILALGGFTWKAKQKTHIGTCGDAAALARLIEMGVYDDTKRGLEFFSTSVEAAAVMARLLAEDIRWDEAPRVLEPSAGDGVLVAAILNAVPQAQVTAVELEPLRAARLRARFANDTRVTVIESDLLHVDGAWDAVIMNPPFCEALEHLQHIYPKLEVGAPIIGIASIERKCDRELAQWLQDRDAWMEPTETNTFVDTTFRAAYFGFRKRTSGLEQLLDALGSTCSIKLPQVRVLEEYSRDLHALFEAACNDEIDRTHYDERVATISDSIRMIVAPEGIHFELAWDPRAGHGFRLLLPSGRTNDMGGTGMIVPCALPAPAY